MKILKEMANNYQKHQEENRKEIEEQIEKDIKEMNPQQRFGFFSIPCNATIGDEFYTKEAEYHHTIVEGKVIGEKRGIFSQPGKRGKGKDAYFKCMDYAEDTEIKQLKNKTIQERNDMLNTVRARKEKKFVPPFKSPGEQEYKDLFEQAPVQYNKPITAIPPRKFKVVEGKVITEPRGVFTNPPKKGFNNIPGILFSPIPPWIESQKTSIDRRSKSCKPKMKTEYVKPFFPASLEKNECFANIKETFGFNLPDEKMKQMAKDAAKVLLLLLLSLLAKKNRLFEISTNESSRQC